MVSSSRIALLISWASAAVCNLAGTDSPDGLVGYDQGLSLFCGQTLDGAAQLVQGEVDVLAGFTLVEAFTDAEYGGKLVAVGSLYLSGADSVGFTVDSAAFWWPTST